MINLFNRRTHPIPVEAPATPIVTAVCGSEFVGLFALLTNGVIGEVKSVKTVNGERFYGIQQYTPVGEVWIETIHSTLAAESEITQFAAVPKNETTTAAFAKVAV